MSADRRRRHALVRQLNEQAVLDAIFRHGPVSRVDVARLTGLSKPTVSGLVAHLERAGLVRANGRSRSGVGRAAVLYEIEPLAGVVVGIDLGGSKVRGALADLHGEILAERVERTTRRGGRAVLDQVGALARGLATEAGIPWRSVRQLVLACPGVYDAWADRLSLAFNLPGIDRIPVARTLRDSLGVRVTIDNDVTVAAMGERWRGLGTTVEHFVFAAVGTGVGLGIVLGGEPWRGAHGAAGEIAYLPVGGDPAAVANRRRGTLEEAASASGIRRSWSQLVTSHGGQRSRRAPIARIFQAAADGDPVALAAVDREARLLAEAILAVVAVLDPELVVLGGGIGSNPVLLEPVRRHAAQLLPTTVPIERSALGERAAVFGAVHMGLRALRQRILAIEPDRS